MIAEFLEARIAEDEAVARLASESDPFSMYGEHSPAGFAWESLDGMVAGEAGALWDCEMSDTLCTTAQISDHMARNDPDRVLAECAAKRAIIDVHHPHDHGGEHGVAVFCDECQWDHGDDLPRIDNQPVHGFGKHPCRTIAILAAVYSDHPDYRQEWAL